MKPLMMIGSALALLVAGAMAKAAIVYERSNLQAPTNYVPFGDDGTPGRPVPGDHMGNQVTLIGSAVNAMWYNTTSGWVSNSSWAMADGAGTNYFAMRLAASGPPVQWTVAGGGNGNYYERVEAPNVTFQDAKAAAAAKSFNGLPGRLLVLEDANYAAEQAWVFSHVFSADLPSNFEVYWIGAARPGSGGAANENWTWVTGATVNPAVVTDADFYEGNVPYGAVWSDPTNNVIGDYAQSNPAQISKGYIVEYAVPEPHGMTIAGLAALLLVRRTGKRNLRP